MSWLLANWRVVGLGLLVLAGLAIKIRVDYLVSENARMEQEITTLVGQIAAHQQAIRVLEDEKEEALALSTQVTTIRERVYVTPPGGCVGDAVRSTLDGLRGLTPADTGRP